jgi:hypothetical protein
MVHSRAERVLIFDYFLASKSFAALREVFNNAYAEKEYRIKQYTDR